ncbi:MAG: MMPL family transporter [Deltaproteobacteria bacterium]|nr:MMPL family transporter [Deltaproteobacteria bacterium]
MNSGPGPGGAAGPWDRVAIFVQKRRVPILVVATALTALSAAVSPRIETTSDPTAYLPRDRPEVDTWIRMNQRFGVLHTMMIGLEEADAPLTTDGLSRLSRITDGLGKQDGVLLARSLTNVQTLRLGEDGTINAELMVPSIPQDQAGLKKLADRILGDMQVPGALVSRDLKGYMVLIRLDPRKDPRAAARKVRAIVDQERGPMGAFYFGAPFITNMVTHNVYAKLIWIVPIFVVLLFGVLLIRTRNVWSIVLVMFCSGLSLVWWLASMDLAGYALTMTSVNGLLLILVAAALTYARGVQYRLEGRANPLPPTVMVMLVGAVAAFAAVIAFGHLTPVSLPYLARFGEAMAIGMLAVAAVGVMVFLPMVSFLKPVLADRPETNPAVQSRKLYLNLLVFVVMAAIVGSTQIRFAVGLRDLFTDSGEVGRTLAFFDRRFGGDEFIQVDVKGDLRDPAVASRIMRLTDLLEGSGAFADVRSISQVLGFLAHRFSGVHRIPVNGETLNNLWFFLEGSDDVRPMVNDDRNEAMLALRVQSGNQSTSADLVSAVNWAIDGSARKPPASCGPVAPLPPRAHQGRNR